jgi:hypothetical protein
MGSRRLLLDGVEHLINPIDGVGINYEDIKTMLLSFDRHTVRVIDVKVDSKSVRPFRWKRASSEAFAMPDVIDDIVHSNAMQPEPSLDRTTATAR